MQAVNPSSVPIVGHADKPSLKTLPDLKLLLEIYVVLGLPSGKLCYIEW